MNGLVYNILFALGYAVLLPRFLRRMWRRGGYRRGFAQRFARYDADTLRRLAERPRVWVHAVSVGEVYVASAYIRALRAERPDMAFILTTTTSTGHAIACGQIADADLLLYYPLDFPWIVRRALDAARPLAVLLTEGEIWPNFILTCRARGIPVALINGRVSESSQRGYRLVRRFVAPSMAALNPALMQSDADARRMLELGAVAGSVHVAGAAKYDLVDTQAGLRPYVADILRVAGAGAGRPVLLGGSTWPGEESILLDALESLRAGHPGLFLVLVPRHVERTRKVIAELRRRQVRWVLRSQVAVDGATPPTPAPDVLLVDTTGELKDFYAHADVIFIGKSLTQTGGQNVIEPAALGKAVVVGPNMQNFAPVMRDLLADDAIVQVADAAGLVQALGELLSDGARRAETGRRAADAVARRRGAVSASLRLLLPVLDAAQSRAGS